jgi:hypothetical protein
MSMYTSCTTAEIPIPQELLDRCFPATRRESVPPVSIHEGIIDAIIVDECRRGLAETRRELPAIRDREET